MKTKDITTLAMTLAVSLVLSYLESLIPLVPTIPGIKVGLANIAVVAALYKLGPKQAALISLLRVMLVSLMFGSAVSLAYSLSGACLSLLVMITLKKTGKFTWLAVSVGGGIGHNIGQLIAAAVLLETDVFKYYLPVLVISGVVTGIIVGFLANAVLQRVKFQDA